MRVPPNSSCLSSSSIPLHSAVYRGRFLDGVQKTLASDLITGFRLVDIPVFYQFIQ